MTPEDLKNEQEKREFWKWLITYVMTTFPVFLASLLTPIISAGGLYYSISNNTHLEVADKDRAVIKETINDAHAMAKETADTTKTVASEVKVAAGVAKLATEEAKTVAQETKTVVMALKYRMNDPEDKPPN